MNPKRNTIGWIIAMAALGINLILGILYSWSVIAKVLVSEWGWSHTQASLPYTVCVVTFALMMIFAGRAQDKYGPKLVAFLGGILFGIGLIVSAFAKNPSVMVITFGILGGMGIGFGYSAVTPCSIKWFEPKRKGIISGIVVSGVGLSPVYIAPLTQMLLNSYGIEKTFLYLGFFALAAIMLFSLVLRNPPQGYVPASTSPTPAPSKGNDYTWQQMIRTKPFIMLWLSYLMSAMAGLMLIAHMASIANVQASWQAGYKLVVILSVFNALGRVVGGWLSDRAGRTNALFIVFAIQAVNMVGFVFYQSVPTLIFGAVIAGLAYGALFALFPATTADFFGVKNLGVNYGIIFTGWGVAGIIGPILGGKVVDLTGTYSVSYMVAAAMLLVGLLIVKFAKAPAPKAQ
jgi:MFS transporter, OFA family, oxalate/formate antiporter